MPRRIGESDELVAPWKKRRRGGGGEASAISDTFRPAHLAGLTLWLDAGIGVTAVSDRVTLWADRSGNGRDASAAGGNRPYYRTTDLIGMQRAVYFDGTGTLMAIAGVTLADIIDADEHSVFVVFEATTLAAKDATRYDNAGILAGGGAFWGLAVADNGATEETIGFNWDGNSDSVDVEFAAANTPTYTQFLHGGGLLTAGNYNGKNSYGGAASSGSTTDLTNTPQLGASHDGAVFFNGLIGEIIVYDRQLGPLEITQVRNYLRTKWGA